MVGIAYTAAGTCGVAYHLHAQPPSPLQPRAVGQPAAKSPQQGGQPPRDQRNAEPSLRDKAQALLRQMDFGFYYDPAARGAGFPAGELRGGFYPEKPTGCSVPGNYVGRGPEVYYTCNHYDILNTDGNAQ